MPDPKTDQEIIEVIRSAIAQALLIDPDKIKPESRLFDDLGAESIDILDLRFRIEEALDIRINQAELIGGISADLDANKIRQGLTVARVFDHVKKRVAG